MPLQPHQKTIALVNAAHSFTHYCLLILPTAVLTMAHPGGSFGSDYGPILALATGGFLLYGLFSLPQGWLAGRIGRRALMGFFFFGTGLSMIATGFAATPMMLALALGAMGLFAAIYHPIGTAILIDAAGDKPGSAIGLNGVCGNIGVAPIITAGLIAAAGWEFAYILPGIACVIAGVIWLRIPALEHGGRRATRPFPDIPPALVRRAVIVLLMIAAASGLLFNAFTLLIPKLMQERLAGDPSTVALAGLAATIATLCGAVTQLTVGRLIDRHTLRRVFLPMGIGLAPAMFALAYAPGWTVLPVAGAVAAIIFGQVTVNETMTARYIAPAVRAKMYSIRFFIGFLGSAAAAPLVGFLHELTGNLSLSVLVLAGFSLVILASALFFPNRPEELHPELWSAAPAE